MEEMMAKLKQFVMNLRDDEELSEVFNVELHDSDFAVKFICKENPEVISVLNLYSIASRLNDGESVEHISDVIKKSLLEQYYLLSSLEEKDFSKIKDTIFPQIKGDSDYKEDLPVKHFDKDGTLKIYYVRDLGTSMAFVTADNLKDWGITLDEIHEVAIENLNKQFVFPKTMQQNGETANFFMYNSRDSYDATRLLTLDLEVLQDKFEGRIFAVAPNRDFLAVCDEYACNLEALKYQTVQDYNSKSYPVSPYIYVYENGVWSVLK